MNPLKGKNINVDEVMRNMSWDELNKIWNHHREAYEDGNTDVLPLMRANEREMKRRRDIINLK